MEECSDCKAEDEVHDGIPPQTPQYTILASFIDESLSEFDE